MSESIAKIKKISLMRLFRIFRVANFCLATSALQFDQNQKIEVGCRV